MRFSGRNRTMIIIIVIVLAERLDGENDNPYSVRHLRRKDGLVADVDLLTTVDQHFLFTSTPYPTHLS